MTLRKLLEDELHGVAGSFGIAVTHIQTGEKATVNATNLYQMASTFKVPILATLFREVEKGMISLDDHVEIGKEDFVPGSGVLATLSDGIKVTIKDLAMLMIIVSDNIATDQILKRIGIKNVSLYMKEIGLYHLYVNQSCRELLCLSVGIDPSLPEANEKMHAMDFNSSSFDKESLVFQVNQQSNAATPEQMNRLLVMLAKKEILTASLCDMMLGIMAKQQFNHRIPYLLPENTTSVNKTGTISDVINDVGIVYLPDNKGAFAITVFSKGSASMEEGERTISHLTQCAYHHFLKR